MRNVLSFLYRARLPAPSPFPRLAGAVASLAAVKLIEAGREGEGGVRMGFSESEKKALFRNN